MTIILELPPDLQARLSEEAAGSNISEEKLAFQLIAMALPPAEFQDNAAALEYWKQISLVGMWADREDMEDSTAWVQQQRYTRT